MIHPVEARLLDLVTIGAHRTVTEIEAREYQELKKDYERL